MEFSPLLARWKAEIEKTGARQVIAARIYTDTSRNELLLPQDAEQRRALAALLRSPRVTGRLHDAYAITVNLDRGTARASFILLNMRRAGDWGEEESALLAHELGHVWLHVNGYAASAVSQGCESVRITDIVQHVLIREEAAKRMIPLEAYMARTFDLAYQVMKSGAPKPDSGDSCARAGALSLLVDIRASQWVHKKHFEWLLAERFPGLPELADTLAAVLRQTPLRTREGYLAAVRNVASIAASTMK